MAKLVAGLASSHAYTLLDPSTWDAQRLVTRGRYKARHGHEAPVHPMVEQESDDDIHYRYAHVRSGLDSLSQMLRDKNVDTLVVVADDQDENFKGDHIPAWAVYLGDSFEAVERGASKGQGTTYRCQSELAREILFSCTVAGFELSAVRSFPDDLLLAHAVGPMLERLVPDMGLAIVPLFVNAIHPPIPTPDRAFRLGAALRDAIEAWDSPSRVAIYASGGLSHFTGSFPYQHIDGRYGLGFGSISEDFDRTFLGWLTSGEADKLKEIDAQDLLENGDHELESWIVTAGAMGDTKASVLAYEPFYRAHMAMGAVYWNVE